MEKMSLAAWVGSKHSVADSNVILLDAIAEISPEPVLLPCDRGLLKDASTGFGFRKLSRNYAGNLTAQKRDVARSRIPNDLGIQIEISMHDSVPYRNDLSPRHFRMTFSQLHR